MADLHHLERKLHTCRVIVWLRQTYRLIEARPGVDGTQQQQQEQYVLSKDQVYAAYQKALAPGGPLEASDGELVLSRPVLGKMVRRAFPQVGTMRRGPRGQVKQFYVGLVPHSSSSSSSTSTSSMPSVDGQVMLIDRSDRKRKTRTKPKPDAALVDLYLGPRQGHRARCGSADAGCGMWSDRMTMAPAAVDDANDVTNLLLRRSSSSAAWTMPAVGSTDALRDDQLCRLMLAGLEDDASTENENDGLKQRGTPATVTATMGVRVGTKRRKALKAATEVRWKSRSWSEGTPSTRELTCSSVTWVKKEPTSSETFDSAEPGRTSEGDFGKMFVLPSACMTTAEWAFAGAEVKAERGARVKLEEEESERPRDPQEEEKQGLATGAEETPALVRWAGLMISSLPPT